MKTEQEFKLQLMECVKYMMTELNQEDIDLEFTDLDVPIRVSLSIEGI